MHFPTIPLKASIIYGCFLLAGFVTGAGTLRYVYREKVVPKPRIHSARFVPFPPLSRRPDAGRTGALPEVDVMEIDRVRRLAGRRARVRGKIYRVGHSRKSDTYFLDFGPSRSSFTAVIFASAAAQFKRAKIDLPQYEGKEVEIVGRIEDDPRYGLEMILAAPGQIKRLDE